MTEHLYYTDSYLTEFSAEAVERLSIEGAPAIVLNRTAFYPTSGGQPHDTGSLGHARVLDVTETTGGTIVHILDSPVAVGPIEGRIDWDRRFDHMQQHTGQHILSQAFVQVARAATISFHLGPESSTIDVEMPQPAADTIFEAEELANRVVMQDRPVGVIAAERGELRALGVRKESQREGTIRVVDVEGFDRSPCGGTHVRRSGEIGIVSILGYERYKGGSRIEFACGFRALRSSRKAHNTLKQLGRLFSSQSDELPRLAEKLMAESAVLKHENGRLREELLELEAASLLESADKFGEVYLVKRIFSARPLETVKLLAQKIAAQAQAAAVLGTAIDGKGQVVVGRGAGVPGNAASWIKQVSLCQGGKGGGRPEFAQAGGITEECLAKWVQAVADAIRTMLPE